MKIILDAMSGDNAPEAAVLGAVDALNEFDDIYVALAGKRPVIEGILSKLSYDKSRLDIIEASDVIDMEDSPVSAIRSKTDSSMAVGLNSLSRGDGDIFISAGNTGALLAGATLIVRRVKGVKRAPLVMQIPTKTGGSVLLLDCGANVDCKAEYIDQFAVMGSIYMKKVAGIKNPRVGLINIGSESHKGNALTKEAYELLNANSLINFVGNAEGRDLMSGDFDIIVADGFTGNVILKFLEGTASMLFGEIKERVMASGKAKFGALFMKSVFGGIKKKFDYKEYGGSLMLGLNGGVVKAHGSSDAKAFKSAVKMARKFILGNVVEEIAGELTNDADKGE